MSSCDDLFTIDVEELLRMIGRMADCETELHRLATHLESRLERLQATWEGEAAVAQQAAQAQWEQGFLAMREALGQIRRAAGIAHGNYSGAARDNAVMWQQVR